MRVTGGNGIVKKWDIATRVTPKRDVGLAENFGDGRSLPMTNDEFDGWDTAVCQREPLPAYFPP